MGPRRSPALVRFLPALLVIAWSLEGGGIAAQTRPAVRIVRRSVNSAPGTRNEFILHAPASRISAIAARYGLTVIRPVDQHGHDTFLVSGPSRFGTRFDRVSEADVPALQQLVSEVQRDPEVGQFEPNAPVVTPELNSASSLYESTAPVEQALEDRTLTNYYGAKGWHGYNNQ